MIAWPLDGVVPANWMVVGAPNWLVAVTGAAVGAEAGVVDSVTVLGELTSAGLAVELVTVNWKLSFPW